MNPGVSRSSSLSQELRTQELFRKSCWCLGIVFVERVYGDIGTVSRFVARFSAPRRAEVKRAEAQTLNFYLWSPDGTKPRSWVDTHLTAVLKNTYGPLAVW